MVSICNVNKFYPYPNLNLNINLDPNANLNLTLSLTLTLTLILTKNFNRLPISQSFYLKFGEGDHATWFTNPSKFGSYRISGGTFTWW